MSQKITPSIINSEMRDAASKMVDACFAINMGSDFDTAADGLNEYEQNVLWSYIDDKITSMDAIFLVMRKLENE